MKNRLRNYWPCWIDGYQHENNCSEPTTPAVRFYMTKHCTMSREDQLLSDYMTILSHLSADMKLRLASKLIDSIRESGVIPTEEKDESWKSLFGAWSDVDENLAKIVRENRLPNREIPSFDE